MAYNKETDMYEGYIYKITNNINDKVYIGQTTQTVKIRWKQHINDSKKYSYPLYLAMNKYGHDKFKIEIIDFFQDSKKYTLSKVLDEKEIYWIKYYNSYKKGYNSTIGGQNNAPNKFPERPINEYDLQGNLLFTYNSTIDASDATGFSRSDISTCALRYKIYRVQNRIFRYVDDPLTETEKEFYIKKYPQICQYDFSGNLINKFDLLRDAAIAVGKRKSDTGNIANVCNGKSKHSYGFVWRYNDDAFDKYQTPLPKIEQHNMSTGELIETYSSYSEAATKTNSKQCCIRSCCNNKSSYHNGYIWCFEGTYLNDMLSFKIKEKKVVQYTLYGDLVNIFNSIKEASDKTNVNRCSIGEVCRGIKNFAGGFIWRYEHDSFDKYPIDIDKLHGYRKINQYTKDNIFIKTFNNISEIKMILNKNISPITSCCKYKLKTSYGYKWFYSNDLNQPDKTKIIA